jgi:hypothetical protein
MKQLGFHSLFAKKLEKFRPFGSREELIEQS